MRPDEAGPAGHEGARHPANAPGPVVLVTPEYPPAVGGIADHIRHLAREIAARGFPVVVACRAQALEPTPGVELIPWAGSWTSPGDVKALADRLAALRPAVVSFHSTCYSFDRLGLGLGPDLFALRLRARGVRHLSVTLHDVYNDLSPHPKRLAVGLLQRAGRLPLLLAPHSVVVNNLTRRRALASWLPRPARLHVVENPSNVHPNGAAPTRTDARPTLGLFGLFQPQKRSDLAVDALARLVARGRDARLLCIGSPPPGLGGLVDDIRAQAAAAGLDGRVEWRSGLDERGCSHALSELDVLLLPQPTINLGTSTAFMAAAAHGLAVVASAQGDRAGFLDGEHLLEVAPGDAEALAQAAARLLDAPEERARLGANLRARYHQGFTWKHTVDRCLRAWGLAEGAAAGG